MSASRPKLAALVVGAGVLWFLLFREFPPLSTIDHNLAIVIPFTRSTLHDVERDFASWTENPPCRAPFPRPPPLYLYPLLPPDENNTDSDLLNQLLRRLPATSRVCFSDITVLEHAQPSTLSPTSSVSDALTASSFYQFLLMPLPLPTSHIFILLPTTRPLRSYWATHLTKLAVSGEPFWIQGAPDASNEGYLDGNAIFAVGDPLFHTFLRTIVAGRYAQERYDRAWYRYLHAPGKEPIRRELLSKFVYSNMVQREAVHLELDAASPDRPFFVVRQNPLMESSVSLATSTKLDPVLVQLLNTRSSKDKNINLIFGSGGDHDMLLNYLHHVKKAHINNYVVIAMDEETKDLCVARDIFHFLLRRDTPSEANASDDSRRYQLIANVLRAGYSVLHADVDVCWLKNPFLFFFSGDFDLEIQSGARLGFSGDDHLTPFAELANPGLFYAKGTSRMADLFDTLVDSLAENLEEKTPYLLNTILKSNDLDIVYRIMAPLLFPSSYQYFVYQLPQRSEVEPFCIRGNSAGGRDLSRHHFRTHGLWSQDSAEHVDIINGRYLVAMDDITGELGWDDVKNSLRSAIAIAQTLGRTLILPPLHAFDNSPEFVTLDMFVDFDAFYAGFNNFRESKYLDRIFPGPPATVFNVALGSEPEPVFRKPINSVTFLARDGQLGASDDEIREWFKTQETEPIIYLSSFVRKFYRFFDYNRDKDFHEMIVRALEPSDDIKILGKVMAKGLMEDVKRAGGRAYNCARLTADDIRRGKSIEDVVARLAAKLDSAELLYVSTGEGDSTRIRDAMQASFPLVRFLPELVDRFSATFEDYFDTKKGYPLLLGDVEQRVCMWAKDFVGDVAGSTFSSQMCYLRYHLGRRADHLCLDIYDRPRLSAWDYF